MEERSSCREAAHTTGDLQTRMARGAPMDQDRLLKTPPPKLSSQQVSARNQSEHDIEGQHRDPTPRPHSPASTFSASVSPAVKATWKALLIHRVASDHEIRWNLKASSTCSHSYHDMKVTSTTCFPFLAPSSLGCDLGLFWWLVPALHSGLISKWE